MKHGGGHFICLFVLLSLLALFIPLPSYVIDFLISLNLLLGMLILLTSLIALNRSKLFSFPNILLLLANIIFDHFCVRK